MKFHILNEDPLFDYREANKITEGLDVNKETMNWNRPKDETAFWIKQIVANHSTLRCIRFRIVAEQPKSVIMQIIRATKGHPQPEVQSSRPDWNNGKERSADPYEEKLFLLDHTAESFVEMAKQRLCMRTEERTRKFMQSLVKELRQCKEPFLQAVGYCCMPYCDWYGGNCPEIKGCARNNRKMSEIPLSQYKLDCDLIKE